MMARDFDRLQTERLILRGINETDAVEIVEWRSGPDVFKYFKSPRKITVQEYFDWYNNSYLQNAGRRDWMCIEKETGKKIGVFGLVTGEDSAEINYLLAPDAQHKGYAAEAVRCLTEFAKNQKILHVVAEIHKENKPSIRLIRKQGFVPERSKGNFEIFGKYLENEEAALQEE